MVLDGIGPPKPAMLSLRLVTALYASAFSWRLFRMQKNAIPAIIATKATNPTVSPTAPPVDNPPLLLFETVELLCEFGGAVGVTVTVRTCPVMVSSDIIGVAVQVELVSLLAEVAFTGAAVVESTVSDVVVGFCEVLLMLVYMTVSLYSLSYALTPIQAPSLKTPEPTKMIIQMMEMWMWRIMR
jgi:hypothetical protein